jgi:hypothetical protein
MASYNLTDEQKQLLQQAVKAIKQDGQENSFYVSIDIQGADIIGINQRFSHSLEDNLLALAQSDLINLRQTGEYTLKFSIKQSGFDAVEGGFIQSLPTTGTNLSIGAIIYGGISGGSVQAVGFASHSEIEQIVNDPALLNSKIDEYLDNLIEAIKDDLSRKNLTEYLTATEKLKEQIHFENPDSSFLKRILQTLTFLGDIEGTISLTAKVWPYIYPLIVIASELLKK